MDRSMSPFFEDVDEDEDEDLSAFTPVVRTNKGASSHSKFGSSGYPFAGNTMILSELSHLKAGISLLQSPAPM